LTLCNFWSSGRLLRIAVSVHSLSGGVMIRLNGMRLLPLYLVLFAGSACNRGNGTERKAESVAFARVMTMAGGGVARSPATPGPLTPTPIPQKLIRSGEISIQLKDIDAGVRRADSIARAQGGLLADTRVNQTDRGIKAAQVTLRVPADRFDAAMAALRHLGQVRSEAIATEDITRAYADLEIRLAVKEATVARLRELLATRTGKLSDVLDVERELARAVTELEQMKGERRFDDQRIATSTITAELLQSTSWGSVSITGPVGGALRKALEVFGASLSSLIYLVVYLIPWVLLVTVLWWAVRRLRRRRPAGAP
jgi:hypothetical protein